MPYTKPVSAFEMISRWLRGEDWQKYAPPERTSGEVGAGASTPSDARPARHRTQRQWALREAELLAEIGSLRQQLAGAPRGQQS